MLNLCEIYIKLTIPYRPCWRLYFKVLPLPINFDNANIVKSVIPHIGVNYGTCEYILGAYETLKAAGLPVYICRCGIDKNQHCTNCKGCSVNKYVLFIEHSTEYKAEKDPLYPVLKAIIESQELPV